MTLGVCSSLECANMENVANQANQTNRGCIVCLSEDDFRTEKLQISLAEINQSCAAIRDGL